MFVVLGNLGPPGLRSLPTSLQFKVKIAAPQIQGKIQNTHRVDLPNYTSNRDSMTPTPPFHSSFQDGAHLAGRRRSRTANPYDPSHQTPPNPHLQTPVTPLLDYGVEIEELNNNDEDAEEDDENQEDQEDIDVEEAMEGEENDVDADEDEGAIEEGTSRSTSYSLLFSSFVIDYSMISELYNASFSLESAAGVTKADSREPNSFTSSKTSNTCPTSTYACRHATISSGTHGHCFTLFQCDEN